MTVTWEPDEDGWETMYEDGKRMCIRRWPHIATWLVHSPVSDDEWDEFQQELRQMLTDELARRSTTLELRLEPAMPRPKDC